MREPTTPPIRIDGRQPHELRKVRFQPGIAPNATGSILIQWGNTHVICCATIEASVPRWMRDQDVAGGWLTAEYSMLPYSTQQRKPRDVNRGKIDGRSQEIQRLIGRSLRAAIDLRKLGSRTIWIDCDVLQADGGTRTAAITGSYVALGHAVQSLLDKNMLSENPMQRSIAAVSLGLVQGEVLLDLCYEEDVNADVDLNLVMDGDGTLVELQGTGEKGTFSKDQLGTMIQMGQAGVQELMQAQAIALNAALAKP